ncbi:hypothetical protein MB02_12515 [Croceicoccus estronivorus]|uniref:nuclear transport factor 2 family protein n=1 Tax=Croceicoccus estronivorus TaxID=1172626 RepID=UPI00082D50AB|nr:nuclear transport factor 2 family protein [Croceicoccus estronivorus]OCC23430.1 hypothetical protein MB02_12515 [Croceicoccus estronivorus]
MSYSHDEIVETVERLIDGFKKSEEMNNWSWLADEFYHKDCVYDCQYGGVMPVVANGVDEIRATHYGRDMSTGWEGWTFPYVGYAVNGKDIVTHWLNRGPGLRPDGTHYETHGVSFITYGGDGKFTRQTDMFDIGHQMVLCDELDAAGLLSPQLKREWVEPMKARIAAAMAPRDGTA